VKKTVKNEKNKILRRYGPVINSVESVLRPEESLLWGRFVEQLGFELGMKQKQMGKDWF